jgi:hypothetical protein
MKHAFLWSVLFLASCASQPRFVFSDSLKEGRALASMGKVVPAWAPQANDPREIVDAVIARLGPVRTQANTQMCFAFAGADMATYASGQRVSAFSVAGQNFANRSGFDYVFFNPGGELASQLGPDSRFMLGLASSTLKTNLMGKLCAEDQPNSNLSYRDQNLKRLWNEYGEYRSYIGPTKPEHLYSQVEHQLRMIAPSLNAADFASHMSRYQPLDYALAAWFGRQCNVQLDKSLSVQGGEFGLAQGAQVVASLDRALDSNQIAMIHYDPGVLNANTFDFTQSVIGFHVSTIVARAKFGAQNFYLLRNTWGDRCNHYSDSIGGRCDRGHVWLSEEEVRKYVTSVAYYSK